MGLEVALVAAAGGAVALALLWRGGRGVRLATTLCVGLAGAGAAAWSPGPDAGLGDSLPAVRDDSDYVGSDGCRACHPGPDHSWRASFHRTMTQAAEPDVVLADFDDVRLDHRGLEIRLSRRGDEFWAELPDPLWFEDPSADKPWPPPRIEARIVMTTGSHHLQNYWLRRPESGPVHRDSHDNGALVQLPFVWIIDAGRWVPAQDSFLTPPSSQPEPILVWNTSCHLCHSVATRPGYADGAFDTASAELGVACEACHGPGRTHSELHRSPWKRYAAHLGIDPGRDPMIENAASLGRDRSVEACGQCHSFSRVKDVPKWQREGVSYRPGEPLEQVKSVLRYSEDPTNPHLLALLEHDPNALVGRYWRDGTIRVAGRELNGVVESACYQQGTLTCVSCHSMHDYESPDDQLVRGGRGNGPCLECHPAYVEAPTEHTRHAEDSAGSLCMNCHMPHTTYGLFKAIRSHRIDSPGAAKSAETGRPNACNLCHLDRTLAWTDRELQHGWGVEPAALPEGADAVSAAVEWTLAGDAAQRAITAWHMGWEPARVASGRDWQALYLAQLLSDPYAAVRAIAHRSISTLPGFEDFEYDYVSPPPQRVEKSREAWQRWDRASRGPALEGRVPLLLGREARPDRAAFIDLLEARDNTPIRIIE